MTKRMVNISHTPDFVDQSRFEDPIPLKEPWYFTAYTNWGKKLVLLTAFLLPLKLSFVYAPLFPLLLLWYLNALRGKIRLLDGGKATFIPFLVFVAILFLSAPFGIHPGGSVITLIDFVFFSAILLVVSNLYHRGEPFPIFLALIYGETVASFHSVLYATFPLTIPKLFLPRVSESGQIALILVVTFGVVLTLLQYRNTERSTPSTGRLVLPVGSMRILFLLLGALNFSLYLSLSFFDGFGIGTGWHSVLVSITAIALLATVLLYFKFRTISSDSFAKVFLMVTLVIPFISSTLILNLKRGPWLGVIVATTVFFGIYARKFLVFLFATALLILILIPPVRARLQQSEEHFYIRGGRNVIWTIGLELAAKYPLGIGYNNSPILREFSPEIPPELKHFHSNPLNILVEGGWLGLGAFAWWIISLLKCAYRERKSLNDGILMFAIGCAILSWQVAGLVEYNFGDTEVALVAFILMGALHAMSNREKKGTLR